MIRKIKSLDVDRLRWQAREHRRAPEKAVDSCSADIKNKNKRVKEQFEKLDARYLLWQRAPGC